MMEETVQPQAEEQTADCSLGQPGVQPEGQAENQIDAQLQEQGQSQEREQIQGQVQEQGPEFDIILASASPRRRDLLQQAGVSFRVRTPENPVDETLEPDDLRDPHQAAKKLAERKAGAVVQEVLSENYMGYAAILGSDTMVVCDGKIFGKPASLSDAKHMLRQLSGRTHEVVTAVSVWLVAAPTVEDISLGFRTFADATYVEFHDLDDEAIDAYLREGESFDKAGAYAIQGKGERLVKRISGSMSTVIGLPVERLLDELPDIFAPSGRS